MEYKLLLWKIHYTVVNRTFHANGNVYGNPKFNDGKNINTSAITDAEYKGENLVIYTLNSVYLLPLDSHDGIDFSVVNSMTEFFQKCKKTARRAAEKLLSAGECLVCSYNVMYYSEKGIIELERAKNSVNDFDYEYPDENFRIAFDKNCLSNNIDISYILCSDDSANKNVYVISAENPTISKYRYSDFKLISCLDSDDFFDADIWFNGNIF